ncbi:gamma-interferon-inducible lysosomal thiol reductase-like [Hyposmocoma kahamanoa]|uniref:gamma-interferon-inducible lysosomal thiol reductase-like n=1 Tax=Hyposmocoma kahamanoa TaxID=1477025 RepID=UPI000E6D9FAA|nr:gamma-interferon-inducible lysosomal thiol reductase-like [Hyposmocoma kahamanoa]
MMCIIFFLFSFIYNINCGAHSCEPPGQGPETVKLQVFYECLCPGCIHEYTTQLSPTIQKLHDYLDLETYPFGNGQMDDVSGTITFHCQHGPDECYGNALHACAIDILKSPIDYVNFNSCLMNGGSTDNAADECGKSRSVNPTPIKTCAKSDKAVQLLKVYAEETLKRHLKYMPYVLINGQECDYNKPLMAQVCSAFKNPPKECDEVLKL